MLIRYTLPSLDDKVPHLLDGELNFFLRADSTNSLSEEVDGADLVLPLTLLLLVRFCLELDAEDDGRLLLESIPVAKLENSRNRSVLHP